MSDIRGNGYGDIHNWKRGETEQNSNPIFRSTFYKCIDCDESFRHFYHETPNIFEAMELDGVQPHCEEENKL